MEARHGRGRALPRDQESRNKQDLHDKGIGRATKAKSPRSPTDENTDSRERCRMMMMLIMLVNMSTGCLKKVAYKVMMEPKNPSKIEFCGATFSHGQDLEATRKQKQSPGRDSSKSG